METGIVHEIKSDNQIIVNLDIRTDCEKCSSNAGCNKNIKCENLIEARCNDKVNIGDRVEVNISPKKRVVFALLVFLAPILFLFLFYYISNKLFSNEKISIIMSFAGISIYFILLFIISKFAPNILNTKVTATKI